jgi:DNA polymerase
MDRSSTSITPIVITSFEQWRDVARRLIASRLPPEAITFLPESSQTLLFTPLPIEALAPAAQTPFRVPESFMSLAQAVACHRDNERWNLLYRALWRLISGEPHLMRLATDDLVHRLTMMRKAVDRDCHKMKAFVRFRKVRESGIEHYVAWHRPDHLIVRRVAPFFARRFKGMAWSILTPEQSAHWDGNQLRFERGVPRSAAPNADELEQLWKGYYRAIFNPARIKIDTMKREMPVRHWQTLPETDLIDDLLQEAPQRVTQMIAITEGLSRSAADYVPARTTSLKTLATAAAGCQGCDLCREATQTVFGEGSKSSLIMMVGEQPGDEEDKKGVPFVGPAGRLLNSIMEEAGVARDSVYVTNAVKHFSFERVGKRRLHKKPLVRQIIACKPWLEAEIRVVRPRVIVCLGATAVGSLLGRQHRLTDIRGQALPLEGDRIAVATWHPSAILRAREPLTTVRRQELMHDLQFAQKQLEMLHK